MEKKEYGLLKETLFSEILPGKARVMTVPKPDFGKYYAILGANYGSLDTRFRTGAGEWTETPAGTAHYLEHKNFDTRTGNALQLFSANGASPNAFTSAGMTGYYFECTEKFEENLELLLNFVTTPCFTPESVAKEQGIIGQEIRMIEDNPSWVVYTNLMKALYRNHPVRVSVAGSLESISHITADTLALCHRSFYTPGNMALCVAGPVDAQRVCELARKFLPDSGAPVPERDYGAPEPEETAQTDISDEMEVSRPLFLLGFKLRPDGGGTGGLRQKLTALLAADALCGETSEAYEKLYNEGLIDRNFSCGYESYPGAAFLYLGGESGQPEKVRAVLLAEAEKTARNGIDPARWEQVRRASYGAMLRALNSFENICIEQVRTYFSGGEYFLFPEIHANIGKDEAEALIRESLTRKDRTALSVVRPSVRK